MALQMSRTGLLKTLLHQIFQSCLELIRYACPDRWEAFGLFNGRPRDWTEAGAGESDATNRHSSG